jgi:hypothetical protein
VWGGETSGLMLATSNTVVSVLRGAPTDEWLSISDISGVVDSEREIELIPKRYEFVMSTIHWH